MKLTLIQSAVSELAEENVCRAESEIQAAARRGAELAVLPEMFCCPYSPRYFRQTAQPQGGEIWRRMSAAARENGIWLVAGSMPEREGERIYNTSFVFDPQGRQIARHRKIHLFDVELPGKKPIRESDTFTPGEDITIFNAAGWRVGLCICFDLRFPELLGLMALQGAELILVPAAFTKTTGEAHWETLLRARAMDCQVYTAGCAPARDNSAPYVTYGHSLFCSPWGEVQDQLGEGPGYLDCALDQGELAHTRTVLPVITARREDVYRLEER